MICNFKYLEGPHVFQFAIKFKQQQQQKKKQPKPTNQLKPNFIIAFSYL